MVREVNEDLRVVSGVVIARSDTTMKCFPQALAQEMYAAAMETFLFFAQRQYPSPKSLFFIYVSNFYTNFMELSC